MKMGKTSRGRSNTLVRTRKSIVAVNVSKKVKKKKRTVRKKSAIERKRQMASEKENVSIENVPKKIPIAVRVKDFKKLQQNDKKKKKTSFVIVTKKGKIDVKTPKKHALFVNAPYLFEANGKIYAYESETWHHRGTGQVRIVRDNARNQVCVQMREKDTDEVTVNFVCGDNSLRANGSKSWLVSGAAFDNEGRATKVISEYALRFGDKESAKKFKAAFERAQAHNAKVGDVGEQTTPVKTTSASSVAEEAKSESKNHSLKTDRRSRERKRFEFSAPAKEACTWSISPDENESDVVALFKCNGAFGVEQATCVQLKAFLRSEGEKLSGSKRALIDRCVRLLEGKFGKWPEPVVAVEEKEAATATPPAVVDVLENTAVQVEEDTSSAVRKGRKDLLRRIQETLKRTRRDREAADSGMSRSKRRRRTYTTAVPAQVSDDAVAAWKRECLEMRQQVAKSLETMSSLHERLSKIIGG